MSGAPSRAWDALSFLADPGSVADWRLVVLYAAAADAGLVERLPGSAEELAAPTGLDPRAVAVVLEALAAWGVVQRAPDGRWAPGPAAPGEDEAAVIRHHAGSLRLWAGQVDQRLRGAPPEPGGPRRRLDVWLDALAVNARSSAPGAVDACLARVPHAARALDLGGGHGEYGLELARRGLAVTMQDRPEVVELARRRGRLEAAGVDLFAADFFEALPPGPFDLVLCAGVTYTYGAGANRELFHRARPVVAPAGALAVHTFLGGGHPLSAVFAVQMLMATSDGGTHREEDYRQWLGAAGYGPVETVALARPPESLVLAFTPPP